MITSSFLRNLTRLTTVLRALFHLGSTLCDVHHLSLNNRGLPLPARRRARRRVCRRVLPGALPEAFCCPSPTACRARPEIAVLFRCGSYDSFVLVSAAGVPHAPAVAPTIVPHTAKLQCLYALHQAHVHTRSYG